MPDPDPRDPGPVDPWAHVQGLAHYETLHTGTGSTNQLVYPAKEVDAARAQVAQQHAQKIEKLEARLALMSRILDRVPLCPDCRDKEPRGTDYCTRCTRQKAEAELTTLQAAHQQLQGQLPNWVTVQQQGPPPHQRHTVRRDGWLFTATPCYGMHAPWWVVLTMDGEAEPVAMLRTDEWLTPTGERQP